MKASKFSEAQVAFVLKQAEDGSQWRRSAARPGSVRQRFITGEEVCGTAAIRDEASASA